MKLPRALPALQPPAFVLAPPPFLQYGLLLLGTVLPFGVLVWIVRVQLADALSSSHLAAAVLMVLVLALTLQPRHWRAWVVFAADSRGVYLSTFRAGFVHVPWRDVGESAIGVAGIGSNRQRTVILPLRVSDADWASLVGGRLRRVGMATDAQGFRAFGIGSAWRDVEATRREIESLREAARTPLRPVAT